MDKMLFNPIVPRIRVLESRLFDRTKLERMVQVATAEGAIDFLLQEAEYARYMETIHREEDYEKLLSEELVRVYDLFYEMTPVKEVVDVMTVKYDYHNLQVLVKEKLLKADFSHILVPVGTMPLPRLRELFQAEKYSDLSSTKAEGLKEVFADFEATGDPQRIGIILDHYMYREMLEIAERVGDEFLITFVKAGIDLENFETLLRIKQKGKGRDFFQTVLLDGGSVDKDRILDLLNDTVENISRKLSSTEYAKMLQLATEDYVNTGSLKYFDKLKDDYLMKMVKNSKFTPFGLEAVIGYLHGKEMELSSIRVIMVGKLNNIPLEAITERLRETYE